MNELEGRVAVITGAASGIGLALARRFARAGMHLVLADIDEPGLDAAAGELSAIARSSMAIRTDVSREEDLVDLADRAWKQYGAVHLLCNNAGVAAPALRTRPWESSLADWHWMLQVNLMGVLHGIRAFVPRMIEQGDEGHIVNTASVAGLLTGSNPYHVSKHGVTCLTEGLYRELKAMGSRLSASLLCPGLIRTEIANAERHRPQALGRTQLESMPEDVQRWAHAFRRAIDAGYEPSVVADAVHDAVLADRFYVVVAQPELRTLIAQRLDDLAHERNPTIPAP